MAETDRKGKSLLCKGGDAAKHSFGTAPQRPSTSSERLVCVYVCMHANSLSLARSLGRNVAQHRKFHQATLSSEHVFDDPSVSMATHELARPRFRHVSHIRSWNDSLHIRMRKAFPPPSSDPQSGHKAVLDTNVFTRHTRTNHVTAQMSQHPECQGL